MPAKSPSRTLATLVVNLSCDNLPAEVVEQCKTRILEGLGTCFAGRDLAWSAIAVQLAARRSGRCSIIGHMKRAAAEDAAFANAVMSHSILMEDCTTDPGYAHPSPIVVPAALAIAEEAGLSGKEVISAVVLGYEVLGRIGLAMDDRLRAGFRSVPLYGVFGAAAAASRLMHLNEDETTAALGYAANFASGLTEGWKGGTMEGMFQVGLAARNGLMAAALAGEGATSSETALDGERGFYKAFAGATAEKELVLSDLGKRYLIMEVLTKLYPASLYHQMPIYLASRIMNAHSLEPGNIEKVRARVSPSIQSSPVNDYPGPFMNPFQAQLSARFCLAAAFLGRPVAQPSFYSKQFDDPEIFLFAKKVELVAEEGRKELAPRIDVFTAQGAVYSAEGDGAVQLAPTRALMEQKFMSLTSPFLGQARATETVGLVMDLENLEDISTLTDKLVRHRLDRPGS